MNGEFRAVTSVLAHYENPNCLFSRAARGGVESVLSRGEKLNMLGVEPDSSAIKPLAKPPC